MTDKTRPDYYKAADGGDVLDFILRFKLPFAEGCVVKYICRSVSGKPGATRLDDLMKAKEYIERLIRVEATSSMWQREAFAAEAGIHKAATAGWEKAE